MCFDAVSSEEGLLPEKGPSFLTGTSGIPSRCPPPCASSPALADRSRARLRRVAPSPVSADAFVSSLRLTRGFRVVGRVSGCPSTVPTRVGSLPSFSRGPPPYPLKSCSFEPCSGWPVGADPGSPESTVTRVTSSLPFELPRSGRAGAEPMELQARWPSPEPSWSRDPPDLHGHSIG